MATEAVKDPGLERSILLEMPAFPLEGLLQAADQVLSDIVLIVGNEATTGSDSRHEGDHEPLSRPRLPVNRLAHPRAASDAD